MSQPKRMTPREIGTMRTTAWAGWSQDERRQAMDLIASELDAARASEDAKGKEIERLKADNAALMNHATLLAAPVAVLARTPEVAPELREELLAAEQRFLGHASQPHPGTAVLEELTRLRAQVAILENERPSLTIGSQ